MRWATSWSLGAKWLPGKINLVHESNDNECVCLFTFFHFSGCCNLTSINSYRRWIFLSSTAHSLQPTSWTVCFVLHFLSNFSYYPAVPLLAPTVPRAMGFLLGKENYSFFRYLLKAIKSFSHSMYRWLKFFPLFSYASSINHNNTNKPKSRHSFLSM